MKQITIFFFFLVPFLCFGQKGTISGKITDGKSKEELVGASVIDQNGKGVSTDIEGNYTLKVETGAVSLSFHSLGYESITKDVTVNSGEILTLDIKLFSTSTYLDIAVVSAGKFEQDLSELTVSMEVIKSSLVEDKNTTSMEDVLQQTPGVVIVDNEPQIRSGSGYSFGAGSRVMVLVDDLPILSGDAGRPSWGFLPVENIEQIEIIKGASSVLYGSAALSGVINIRTAFPKSEPKTKVTLFHGIYSDPTTIEGKYWSGSPMMSGLNFLHSRKIGGLSMVIGGSVLGDDGHLGPIHDENGEPAPSNFNPRAVDRYGAETRGRINMNLRYQPESVSGLSFGINTNWLKGESLSTLLWGNDTTGLYSAFAGAATRTKQVVGNVDPFIEYLTAKGSRHSLKGRWQKLDNDNDNGQGNFSDVYYGEYQWQQNFDSQGIKDLTTTAGLVGIITEGEAQLYVGGNADGKNSARNYACFLQVDKKFWEKLNVSMGVRYEYFQINDESESKPVFRGGVSYKAGRATFLRASFGQGYRFPTIAEKFIRTAVGVLNVYPSAEIQSETSYNAEIGVKQGFKIGNFKGLADVAFFTQEYNNFIEFTFGQWDANPSLENFLGLGFRSLNTGKSAVSGVDFSVLGQGDIGKFDLQLLAGYTYSIPISLTPDFIYATSPADSTNIFALSDFREVNYTNTSSNSANNILKYRMQHLVRADVQADYEQWTLGLSVRYNSLMQNIDAVFETLDNVNGFPQALTGINNWRDAHNTGDMVMDVRIAYKLKEIHRVSLIVNNMLNHEYAIRPLTIEAPRTTVIQYSIKL